MESTAGADAAQSLPVGQAGYRTPSPQTGRGRRISIPGGHEAPDLNGKNSWPVSWLVGLAGGREGEKEGGREKVPAPLPIPNAQALSSPPPAPKNSQAGRTGANPSET